ncbi:Hsp20/alpha crystallin family protein [Natroniella sulfidigena]|uniref:Hsp20/alpha crystallin family protein n=1 Tax=Natroniella sulfidigena TaxID=723921 RepID=UPI00200A9566|nr:Hsp20/alpha crystallin family protein [Natroniella sulfidigena]MCK8818170.1 Hsp20/alpha crystallin family protein [Natroniella sulfidigena]
MFGLVPFRKNHERGEVADLDDFFETVRSNFFDDFKGLANTGFRTDVKETEDEYVIQSELPGLNKEDIDLELTDDLLTISVDNQEEIKDEGEDYIRRERRTGKYQRSFRIENVKEDEIRAEYENGILEVRLPKEESGKKRRRVIDIN